MVVQIYNMGGRWTFREPSHKGCRKLNVQVPAGSRFHKTGSLGTDLFVPDEDGLLVFSHTATHVYEAAKSKRKGFRILRGRQAVAGF